MRFLAKSKPEETIEEHTNKLIECFNDFMTLYGCHFTDEEKELIKLACEYHDLGKLNYIFQKIVRGQKSLIPLQIPHGFLSCAFLNLDELEKKYGAENVKILCTAIHYHHSRENSELNYKNYIKEYLYENAKLFLGHDVELKSKYLKKLLFINNSPVYTTPPSDDVWIKYALIKGMLNKFDYTASSMRDVVEIPPNKDGKIICDSVLDKYKNSLLPAQEFMYNNQDKNLIVIAPTGSGKTEAGLLWLGDDKGFYTLPLKVSSNSIYKRIKDTYNYENTGLLHSDSISTYINNYSSDEDEGKSLKTYENVKSLCMPLTVCTVDQLFKFVFKALGTEIFLATLKYSKIIIDEMQMYSPQIVASLIYGLELITKLGGKFAIITATLPPLVKELLETNNIKYVSKEFLKTNHPNRHIIKMIDGDFDIEKIINSGKTKKVIVICNTVDSAQALKRKIPNSKILHSKFIKAHRNMLENDILKFAENKDEKGIWICTQIVEASLDIDFDELHTEMCVADSLLQRLGRCFRNRDYNEFIENIYVYNNKNGIGTVYDECITSISWEELKKYKGRIFTEAEKQDFMNSVYATERIKNTEYYEDIKKRLDNLRTTYPTKYNKEEADNLFREMKSVTVIPETIYNENYSEIDSLINIINDINTTKKERFIAKEKLYQYTISIQDKINLPKDKHPIAGTDIYRIAYDYKFDESTHSGEGMSRETIKDNNQL